MQLRSADAKIMNALQLLTFAGIALAVVLGGSAMRLRRVFMMLAALLV